MATLLAPPEEKKEVPILGTVPSSGIEREVLRLLRRPARYPTGLREIHGELIPYLTELQIQNAIMTLIEDGLVAATYTSGYELGLKLTYRVSIKRGHFKVYSSNK